MTWLWVICVSSGVQEVLCKVAGNLVAQASILSGGVLLGSKSPAHKDSVDETGSREVG